MPDELELTEVPTDRPPIIDAGYHVFVESEFAPGAGRCDRCGGGPAADIHQKPVDQMARIADALEQIAGQLELGNMRTAESMIKREHQAYCRGVADARSKETGPAADAGKVAFGEAGRL